MPDEEPLSVDALRQYQRGIARWENEGGSGVPAETGRSEAPAPDQHPLEASADSTDRAGSIKNLDVAAPRDVDRSVVPSAGARTVLRHAWPASGLLSARGPWRINTVKETVPDFRRDAVAAR
jgi:hypothetical protein